MAIAIFDSVTVSIAAEIMGIFSRILRENIDDKLTSRGITSEYDGISSTSSKVRPSITTLSEINDMVNDFLNEFLQCKYK